MRRNEQISVPYRGSVGQNMMTSRNVHDGIMDAVNPEMK
jgi:hypothetical protein